MPMCFTRASLPSPGLRPSLVAQGDQGIHPGGAPGGEPAGEKGDDDSTAADQRPPRAAVGPKRRHRGVEHAREATAPATPISVPQDREPQALGEDQPEDVAYLGAHGDADAELARALHARGR